MPNPGFIRGTHHLTFCVGGAQEDYDFHVRLLGLKSVKKTVLFDGEIPIYHLYYGNRAGDASTLLTAFPYRQAGWMGKRGTNQLKTLLLSMPVDSIGFWADRLSEAGVEHRHEQLFGTERLNFKHPCGIDYALVGDPEPDPREPYDGGGVSGEHAIRGAYGTTTSVREPEPQTFFLTEGLGGRLLRLRGQAPPVPDRRQAGPWPDPRAGRGARPAAGNLAFRRGNHPPPRARRGHRREPGDRQGLGRRARLHRRLRRQGSRLLLLRLHAQPGRCADRARVLHASRVS